MTVLAYEIMTPSIKAVPQSWTMDRLARFLTDNEITGSPVTDETGEIVGIATLKDITEFRWNASRSESDARMTPEEEHEARRLRMAIFEEMGKVPVEVRDIMTPIVLSVDEQTPVRDIADIMMREHLHRIFITKDEKITGIVTTYDMLKLISDQELTNRCAGNG
ncbi:MULTISPECIES: CBS domain-containing protein [Marinobacter]|jgi:predicted transcriptional regulator|uniref:CBS domain-containing protein n=1 Tax=Marinobacter salarius TaxID=1420917 RepID=A0A1W6KCU5_9GAMM|nr:MULTISPECIES: CBS domain-containing protein [Marinobacter]ARM85223.1 inosine 5'-monophosphate dehydrogenase [Marinobacter salarius]KXJ48665.1 MAG: histidine kinase [Marinobacter sp. Hex_13]MAB52586.1 CBS domain-containing protein [Marinobacter sp.]MBJ7277101.1 CBS domain-containing protein [Marinobacter salarius]MBJ7301371.1 CBS domain-containing protein [Marinobacter salarius]|tara:strand:+ start:1475 stop:1966 length:492 start_codon:yes stop_codon:yes gene_type:complete